MANHKKQHFVPRSYLKAWCDPNTPTGQEPYIWRFSCDGSSAARKAPDTIFHETDLYTIKLNNGGRDLVLEHGLAQLESEFVSIRDTTLKQRKTIETKEHVLLCAFIAASQSGTPTQRDHLGRQFKNILETMDDMMEWAKTATPEEIRASADMMGPERERGITYDEVKALAEKPLQTAMFPAIMTQTPLLAPLDFAVFTCDDGMVFITSDNPCVWFDPEGYKRPPLYQGPALMYESIEITLPVSPDQMIVLNRRGLNGYFPASERLVDELNRRTRFNCREYFVSNLN